MSSSLQKKGSGSKRRRLEPEQQHLAALGGRYSLQCVRGRGSFGEVWEATHRRTAIRVAVKILCPAKLLAAGIPIAKVEREIRVMRLLRHPHVARFCEAIRTDHHVYIVMELAESGQLHDHVAIQGRLPEPQARAIFQQLVSGAAYCHHNMVVHRDLKMENVLLDSHNNVKIVDFGFSKLFRYTKFLSKCCGSPEYAAPELHARREYIGPEVDVWSCGIILYGMLCGSLPFDGANVSDLRRNILRGDFRMPSFVSDDARDLIAGMLIVKPGKRLTMAEVRAHRWLQPDMAPYLAMPPQDASTQVFMQQQIVDDETVERAVTRHGFDRTSLLQDLADGVENEATVAYNLLLSKHFDAPTRYLWTLIRRCQRQAAAGGTTVIVDHHDTRARAGGSSSTAPDSEMQQGHGGDDGTGGSSSSRRQWSLGGFHVLHECPRETMRHIAKALHDLGILFYSSSSSSSSSSIHHHQLEPARRRHRMLCAHFPLPAGGVIPSAAIIRSFLRLTTNSRSNNGDALLEMNKDDDIVHAESLSSSAVFFDIQLYKAGEGGNDHATNYVIDLKRISGPQIPYLHICSQLVSMLRPATH